MGRLLQCAVLLAASMAWAQDAASVVSAVEEAPRHALWLHSSLDNLSPSAAVGYEQWLSPHVSLQLALGGSASQNGAEAIGLGSSVFGNTYSVSTEVQLRWHFTSGVFLAEAVGASWSRIQFPPTSGAGSFGSDIVAGAESVLIGWGHTFGSGLSVELFAGPRLTLSSSDSQISVTSRSLGVRAGVGLGYAF